MRASLHNMVNETDSGTREMIALQLFDKVHDITRRILMESTDFTFKGDMIEVVGKSVEVGSDIEVKQEDSS